MKRKLGYKPPRVPHNTLSLHLAPSGAALTLPDSVDLSPLCGPIIDQGSLGSCTAASGVGAAMLLANRQARDGVWKGPPLSASVLALYYDEREIDGTTGSDAGSSIADSVQAAQTDGYIPDAAWPYSEDPYTAPPVVAPIAKLADEAPLAWDVDTWRACLAMGFPIQFGVQVYSSFQTDSVRYSGIVPMPAYGDDLEGGHAMDVIGFDHTRRLFRVLNSWGLSFTTDGLLWFSYDYLMDASLCTEGRVLRRLAQP